MTDPDGMQGGAAELLAVGMVGNADQLACARESVTGLDRGQPQRAIDLQVTGGLSLRLLPDRGLDVGAAWFDGIPLAWISRVGEVSPAPGGRAPWIDRFGGGLVTTCGLQNVGVASEGHGQHGAFSTTPASDLRTDRAAVDGELELVVTGVVREGDALDSFLECRRRVTTRTGRAAMTLTDTVVNLGTRSVPSPMLYHLNIGAPLWSPGARVVVPRGARTVPRDAGAKAFEDSWDTAPHNPCAMGWSESSNTSSTPPARRVGRRSGSSTKPWASPSRSPGTRERCPGSTSGSIPEPVFMSWGSNPRTARSSAGRPTGRRGGCRPSSRESRGRPP